MPQVVETVGSLQLLKNQFGYDIRGIHDESASRISIHNKEVKMNDGKFALDISNIRVEAISSFKKRLNEYFAVENLGTSCTPRCGGGRCGKCAKGNGNYTSQEERELALIKSGLHYNSALKKSIAHYPWIRDPKELPNNVTVAKA